MSQEPYRDSPGTPTSKKRSLQRDSPSTGGAAGSLRRPSESDSDESVEAHFGPSRIPDLAPTLGPIDTGGGIELPSRIGSRASRFSHSQGPSRAPTLPRRSSRRTPSTDQAVLESTSRLSTVMASPPSTAGRFSTYGSQRLHPTQSGLPIRLPFGSTEPSPSPEPSPNHSAASSLYRHEGNGNYDTLAGADLPPPPSIQGGDRPPSTGYVHQHMARDSIHNDNQVAGGHLETSAEFVDRSRSVSTQGSYNNRNRTR